MIGVSDSGDTMQRKRQVDNSEGESSKSRSAKVKKANIPPPPGQRTISSFFQKKDIPPKLSPPANKPKPGTPEKLKTFICPEPNGQASSKRASPEPGDSEDELPDRDLRRKRSKLVIEDDDEEDFAEPPPKRISESSDFDPKTKDEENARAKLRERFLKRFDIASSPQHAAESNSLHEGPSDKQEPILPHKYPKNTKFTPLEQQYLEIRKQNPDCLLVVEVGYKYRFFEEDALTASKGKKK
ncbi:Mismatch repair protein msh3 [Phlyctochytrium bullatum]|nr:Mismatch repair protein msh3 [Phlyctochytrium bullatum]